MSRLQFRRRLCLVTDVARYSRHTNPEQVDAQQRLTRVMQYACARAGIVWPRPQKQGDGQLIVLRDGLDETKVLPALVLGLQHGLYETNRDGGLFGRLRLRAALAQGTIATAANGYVGEAVIAACRVVDAPQVRDALADDAVDLAVAVTDDLYRDVVAHDLSGLDGREFRQTSIALPGKDFTSTAWVYTPPPGPVPTPGSDVSWTDIGVTVGIGATAAGLVSRVRRTPTTTTTTAIGVSAPGLGAVFGLLAARSDTSTAQTHPAPTVGDPAAHDQPGHDPAAHEHSAHDSLIHDHPGHDSLIHDSPAHDAVHDHPAHATLGMDIHLHASIDVHFAPELDRAYDDVGHHDHGHHDIPIGHDHHDLGGPDLGGGSFDSGDTGHHPSHHH